ncbi:MAG: oxidoreductase [Acidimicrobiia bacterium]
MGDGDSVDTTTSGYRWGIAATGGVAVRFAESMQATGQGTVAAVGSRSQARAREFADRFSVPRAHGSYEALVADPAVDVVYVATPQHRHADDCILALQHGKHVLCEKPFSLNAGQAAAVARTAAEHDRFVMEAMWTRFLPSYVAMTDAIAAGRIGEPLMVEADFGWRAPVDPTHRHFDATLGGGGLLDLGVYPVHLALLVLGPPETVAAAGHVGATGVDESVAAVLRHRGEGLSVVKSALRIPMACTARIAGREGWIEVPAFMHCPQAFTIRGPGGEEVVEAGWEGDGFRFQVDEVHRCLDAGLRESPGMPIADTIAIAEVLDAIRAQIGVRFPGEDTP